MQTRGEGELVALARERQRLEVPQGQADRGKVVRAVQGARVLDQAAVGVVCRGAGCVKILVGNLVRPIAGGLDLALHLLEPEEVGHQRHRSVSGCDLDQLVGARLAGQRRAIVVGIVGWRWCMRSRCR